MPVKSYGPSRPADMQVLADRLSAEWRSPDPAATEPVILQEANPKGDVARVYVVWSDWAHLDRERRGEVIMEAAERVKPLPEVLKITIAMGLTPEEADRFKLDWR